MIYVIETQHLDYDIEEVVAYCSTIEEGEQWLLDHDFEKTNINLFVKYAEMPSGYRFISTYASIEELKHCSEVQ